VRSVKSKPLKAAIPFLLFALLALGVGGCAAGKGAKAPPQEPRQISFAELDSLQTRHPRPVAVFLHAPWCRYCNNMKQTTFRNTEVVRLLDQHFYFISFDGESKGSVRFGGHRFDYEPSGRSSGTHQLARALGSVDGQLMYPAFVILNAKNEIIFQHQAFLSGKELAAILERAQR
jgi:thioredoxin-related protein